MKNFRWTILAALLVTTSGVAHAQSPAPTGGGFRGPSSSMGSSSMGSSSMSSSGSIGGNTGTVNGAAQDSGNISNADLGSNMTMPAGGMKSPGISSEDFNSSTTTDTFSTTSTETTLANTGGEPVLMSLVGLIIAGGAFMVRRRVTG